MCVLSFLPVDLLCTCVHPLVFLHASSCVCTRLFLCVSVFVCSMEELEMWSKGLEECVRDAGCRCMCVNRHQYSAGWALVRLGRPQRRNTVCIWPIGPFSQYITILVGYFQRCLTVLHCIYVCGAFFCLYCCLCNYLFMYNDGLFPTKGLFVDLYLNLQTYQTL